MDQDDELKEQDQPSKQGGNAKIEKRNGSLGGKETINALASDVHRVTMEKVGGATRIDPPDDG